MKGKWLWPILLGLCMGFSACEPPDPGYSDQNNADQDDDNLDGDNNRPGDDSNNSNNDPGNNDPGNNDPGEGCAPVECELFCEDGFAVGGDGCEVCECASADCPDVDYCGLICAGEPLPETPEGCEVPDCRCPEPDPVCPEPQSFCEAACGDQGAPENPEGCPEILCECPRPEGCLADSDCAAGEACQVPEGCLGPPCAEDDPNCGCPGVCVPQEVCGCPEDWDPVCGVDGQTYGNACEAGCANVDIASRGECGAQCPDVGDYCGIVCAGGEAPEVPEGCPVPGCRCPETCEMTCASQRDARLQRCEESDQPRECIAQAREGYAACQQGCICQEDPNAEGCEVQCPDLGGYCEAACNGEPLPEIPEGCPVPRCLCPEPCVCPDVYAPVCGEDGQTYGNGCEADCANVDIAYEGECEVECPDLGGYCEAACDGEPLPEVPEGCPVPDCLCPEDCEQTCSQIYEQAAEACGDDRECLLLARREYSACLEECPVACPDPGDYCGAVCDGERPPVVPEGCPVPVCDCPEPCICPDIYAPVCGEDGRTYGNGCEARCAGVGIAHEGECEVECPEPGAYCDAVCSGQRPPAIPDGCAVPLCECPPERCRSNEDCEDGLICNPEQNVCQPACAVDCLIPDPVCGEDGQTYYCGQADAHCNGVAVAYEGECRAQCPDAGEYCGAVCDGEEPPEVPEGCPVPQCLCPPEPCDCPDVYAPVCGVDGRTYSNACEARCAGAELLHRGECRVVCPDPGEYCGAVCNGQEPPEVPEGCAVPSCVCVDNFTCGQELTCASGRESCQVTVPGVPGAPTSYSCEALPDRCAVDPTCACLERLNPNAPFECTERAPGQLEVRWFLP